MRLAPGLRAQRLEVEISQRSKVMRLGTTALVASAVIGLTYITMPTASALPAAPRSDVATAQKSNVTQEVRYGRRGYRRWGGYRGYRDYGYYGGYSPYYYRPYYYRPYPYYYGGWGYPYYRRPGFGIYLGY
jgi:hypothetical protein